MRSLIARYWSFLLCWLAIGFTLRTRSFLSWKVIGLSFAVLFTAGLLFDLQGSSLRRRAMVERNLIPPGMLLLGLLPMLSSLFEAWAYYYVDRWSAGPLLPYSDAGGYVNGARSLLTFGQLGEWAARRPLGICLISAVLGITDQNYQAALILLTVLAGLSTFFAARETWRAGGVATAVLYVTLCYFAMRQWLPLFLTETPGYIFGSVSYTFLLAGFRLRSFPRTLCGFGFLILGVTIRAGAMFAIPLLALYVIYFFSQSLRDAFRKGLAVTVVGGALLALGPLVLLRIAPAGTEYQGNLSYTLYGIAAGGKGWSHVLTEHPEIGEISSDGEKSRYVYSLVRQKVAADPSLFVSTLVQLLKATLVNFHVVFYGLMLPIPPAILGALALLAFCLLLLPAWRRTGHWSFLVPVAIGVVLSAPVILDGGLRAFAGTLPLQAGLAASAVGLVFSQSRRVRAPASSSTVIALSKRKEVQHEETEETSGTLPWAEAGFAILLFGAVSVFPLIASFRTVPASVLSWSRNKSEGFRKEVVFYYNPGAGILLGNQQRVAGVMNVPVESAAHAPLFGRDLSAANYLAAGDYLYHAFFLQEPQYGDIFVRFNKVPAVRPGYLKVVVRLLQERGGHFLYVAESFTRIDP